MKAALANRLSFIFFLFRFFYGIAHEPACGLLLSLPLSLSLSLKIATTTRFQVSGNASIDLFILFKCFYQVNEKTGAHLTLFVLQNNNSWGLGNFPSPGGWTFFFIFRCNNRQLLWLIKIIIFLFRRLPNSVKSVMHYRGRAFCAKFSDDGRIFCSASQDELIHLYDES